MQKTNDNIMRTPQQHAPQQRYLLYCSCLAIFVLLSAAKMNQLAPVLLSTNIRRETDHSASFEPGNSQQKVPSGFKSAQTSIDASKNYDMCVVGAGLSGTVLAERTANLLQQTVLVMDSRPHIGGNCYDFHDEQTGILMNKYGSHLFHTQIERVWNYINQRGPKWKAWYHEKLGVVNGTYVPIPVNIKTVNRLFDLNIKDEEDMKEWLSSVQIPCPNGQCQNAEEMAKSRVGEELYKAIFETYTIKQWGKSPSEMNASVTARIPVFSSFDPRYFTDRWQALPVDGYTAWFAAQLNNPRIDVVLNTDFFDHQDHLKSHCQKIVYTGPIDRYFDATGLEKLEYRSLVFHEERHFNINAFVLPTAVVNYPGPETPFTRAVEYKHYLHRPSPHSIVVRETATDDGDPYYPVPTARNQALYAKYKAMAQEETDILFVGRLANYKYFNMDQAIDNALNMFYDHSHWAASFVGERFDAIKANVNLRISKDRESRSHLPPCSMSLYEGEFGTELRAIVPWAYHKSRDCKITTEGAPGTKYMYFFSDSHFIKPIQRQNVLLPEGNPFGADTVQIPNFPLDAEWMPPPFKDFFRPFEFHERFGKPLLFISNKYRKEWSRRPFNFLSVDVLRKLLKHVTPRYHVVYKRHTAEELKDWEDKEKDLSEKDMIRSEFPEVVLFEQMTTSLEDAEDENLLMFTLMAASNGFISVQGGMSVASSYFGGSNVILIKRGTELKSGSYGYFHRFSGANVQWKSTDDEFLESVYKTF